MSTEKLAKKSCKEPMKSRNLKTSGGIEKNDIWASATAVIIPNTHILWQLNIIIKSVHLN